MRRALQLVGGGAPPKEKFAAVDVMSKLKAVGLDKVCEHMFCCIARM